MPRYCSQCGVRQSRPDREPECDHYGELADLDRHHTRGEVAAACHATEGMDHA